MSWGWLVTGLLLGALGERWYSTMRARVTLPPLNTESAAPKPVQRSAAVMVYGATETYSHPDAAKHLRGATWSPGGVA